MDLNTKLKRVRRHQILMVLACCVAVAGCESGQGAVDVDVSSSVDMSSAAADEDAIFDDVAIPVAASAGPFGTRLLPNATSLPGDNFILVQPARGFAGSMSIEAALRAAAPLPAPFEYAIASDFTRGDAGGLSYLERRPADGVTCALAVGSSGGSSVIMRNCVNGDISLALAPLASFGAY